MNRSDRIRRIRPTALVIGLIPVLLFAAWGAGPSAAAMKTVLVLGTDISDTNSLDPQRQFVYSAPITEHAVYETLVTNDAGELHRGQTLARDQVGVGR